MAIACTELAKGATTAVNNFTTASLTFASGSGYIIAFNARRADSNADPGAPASVTGMGGTWTLVRNVQVDARRRTFMYYASDCNATGAITVDWTGTTLTVNAIYTVQEVTGADLSGFLVQSDPTADNPAAATSPSGLALAAFGDATNNATIIYAFHAVAEATTPESGYTETHEHTATNQGSFFAYKVGEDRTPTCSWTTSSVYGAIAAEIKAAAGGTTQEGAAALTVSATIAAPARLTAVGAAALQAVGTVSPVARVQYAAAAALDPKATLAPGANLTAAGGAALAASAALSPAAMAQYAAASLLAATGAVNPDARTQYAAASVLAAAATLGPDARVQYAAASILAGSATLAPLGGLLLLSTAAVTGTGALTPAARVQYAAVVALGGSGTLLVPAIVTYSAASALAGTATLVADGSLAALTHLAEAALSGTGTLSADAVLRLAMAAALAASSTIAPAPGVILDGRALLAGTGALVSPANLVLAPAATLAALASLSPAPAQRLSAASVLQALATLSGSAELLAFLRTLRLLALDVPLITIRSTDAPLVIPGGFPSVAVLDTFNRADGTIRGSGAWASGSLYGGTLPVLIASNRAVGQSPLADAYTTATFDRSARGGFELAVTLATYQESGFVDEGGFVWATTDPGPGIDGYELDYNANRIILFRATNGAYTQIGTINQALASGNKIGIRHAPDGVLTVWVDTGSGWTRIGELVDNTYSVGVAGIWLRAANAMDDFSAGEGVMVGSARIAAHDQPVAMLRGTD